MESIKTQFQNARILVYQLYKLQHGRNLTVSNNLFVLTNGIKNLDDLKFPNENGIAACQYVSINNPKSYIFQYLSTLYISDQKYYEIKQLTNFNTVDPFIYLSSCISGIVSEPVSEITSNTTTPETTTNLNSRLSIHSRKTINNIKL